MKMLLLRGQACVKHPKHNNNCRLSSESHVFKQNSPDDDNDKFAWLSLVEVHITWWMKDSDICVKKADVNA